MQWVVDEGGSTGDGRRAYLLRVDADLGRQIMMIHDSIRDTAWPLFRCNMDDGRLCTVPPTGKLYKHYSSGREEIIPSQFPPFLTSFPIHSYFSCNIQLRTWTQLLFAMSPLIALFYVIYTGFEPEEVERKKRMQTGDFQLDGHAE